MYFSLPLQKAVILLAVGVFVMIASMLWVVINFWWLFLAVEALFIAYKLTSVAKEGETTSEQSNGNS